MTTTGLELCKELYELSGWDDTDKDWYGNLDKYASVMDDNAYEISHAHSRNATPHIAPAYDLGYLLRKLPVHTFIESGDDKSWLSSWSPVDNKGYEYKEDGYSFLADTPEDATCKLAIELFKQGILS